MLRRSFSAFIEIPFGATAFTNPAAVEARCEAFPAQRDREAPDLSNFLASESAGRALGMVGKPSASV
jgi:hypothetical protein